MINALFLLLGAAAFALGYGLGFLFDSRQPGIYIELLMLRQRRQAWKPRRKGKRGVV